MALTSAIDSAIQRTTHGRVVVRGGKGITLVISNEDMDDIIRITEAAAQTCSYKKVL